MSVKPVQTSVGKPFPTSVDKKEVGNNRAEPNMLGRKDLAHKRWQVEDCRPVRGEPMTNISDRVMFAPSADGEMERVVRAHEMMHAKVSPSSEQMTAWVERGVASATAMTVAEELRVNFLCSLAGFDMKNHLQDGSELATGEHMAKSGDWAGAVAMTIATTGTAGLKPFLTGIRRHNRAWGDSLLDISKRAMKEIRKAHKERTLAETGESSGVAPYGFLHTERIGEWVDRLASFPPPKDRKPSKGKQGSESSTGAGGKEDKDSEDKDSEHNAKYGESKEGEGDKNGNPHSRIKPAESTGGTPRWAELVISREPMPRFATGSMGKKRVATNMGIRPRRLHRFMTDPAKRVFDKTVRGSGGMVIIDASGSMSFTTEQIAEIIENAPGATVMIYSDRFRKDGAPNAWIVADKGRMVENVEYIDYGHGNGVDYPAIVWGVTNRQYKNTPLVWVTDGGVCGAGDGFHDVLAMQCITYARQHGYIVVPHVEEAIQQLRNLRTGGNARSIYPYTFRDTYRKCMGAHLE